MKLVPVILSGGAVTRLWPLSRELHPKQLLALTGKSTMLQETVARLDGLAEVCAPIIVCNEAHRFLVAEQLRQLGVLPSAILLEPVGRNTAPALALAAHAAIAASDSTAAQDDDATMLVLPADHVIVDIAAFQSAVRIGMAAASAQKLVTFGIVPHKPETGYGYIRRGDGADGIFSIRQFVEKPNLARAQQFLADGGYYWNSGIFMFQARAFLGELERFAPDIAVACAAASANAKKDMDFTRVDRASFSACRAESVDFAVMEKTTRAVMVPLDAGWSDVGSWAALQDVLPADENGNVVHGDVLCEDCHGNFLRSESRLIAAVGLRDHVVVETKDAVLVTPKNRVQDVKKLVEALKAQGRYEHSLHREVSRPWGSYDSIESGDRFQVKRLHVKPGASLSLQLHHHRAEHWIVVSGTAKITRNDEVFLLEENQSTYIPLGAKHRIENPGKIPLQIIEVQSGSYLGEDDIVRFQDHYGRNS